MFMSQRKRLFVPLFAGMMGFGAFFNAMNGVAFAGLVIAFRGGLGPRG
jgi:hypothetical protein